RAAGDRDGRQSPSPIVEREHEHAAIFIRNRDQTLAIDSPGDRAALHPPVPADRTRVDARRGRPSMVRLVRGRPETRRAEEYPLIRGYGLLVLGRLRPE